jgi:hypothetical protein
VHVATAFRICVGSIYFLLVQWCRDAVNLEKYLSRRLINRIYKVYRREGFAGNDAGLVFGSLKLAEIMVWVAP